MRRENVVRTSVFGVATISALVLVAAGCGGSSSDEATDGDRLAVATTVAPITSIVSNIGGDRVQITGIVPEGTNSHTFEPEPSVAELLSSVDVVYINGLVLEEPTKELAEANLADGAELVELGSKCIEEKDYAYDFSFPKSGGKPNPHLWTNPRHALCYAEVARDDLSARDPDNADYYAENYDKFASMVDEFDGAMRESFSTIPKRELLTYHDAYAYFAAHYRWRVIGAIQVSSFDDPTPRDVVDLIGQVEAEGVPAIFGSEVFPSPVLAQIGKEAGVTYVDELRDDDLPGAPGESGHSYLGLMKTDFVTMVSSLDGDPSGLAAFDPADVAPDRAEYPQ